MNIRKMKMALTVELMNQPDPTNVIHSARETMSRYAEEVGSYEGLRENQKNRITDSLESASFSLLFEKCVLNLDMIRNKKDQMEILKGFQLQEIIIA